jgi:ABC-2 type transport system ATP-binding protein
VREQAREEGGPETLKRAPVAEIVNAFYEAPDGEALVAMPQGEACCVRVDVRFHDRADNPIFSIGLRNELGSVAFATSTQLDQGQTGSFSAGETAIVRIRFENWLAPGRYDLMAAVSRDGLGADAYDLREDISSIIVHASRSGGGLADLPHSLEIERG